MSAREHELVDAARLKALVADLFEPRPAVYWTDLLATTAVAWLTLAMSLVPPLHPVLRGASLVVSSFAFSRDVAFIHEIAHVTRPRWMRWFSMVWNAICGVPVLQPSLLYGRSHLDHHKASVYATIRDPRYLTLAGKPRWRWLGTLLVNTWIAPIPVAFRFLVLGPVSILVGGSLRRLVIQRASTIAMNLQYVRALPDDEEKRIGVIQELGCLAFWTCLVGLGLQGWLPWRFFAHFYLVLVLVLQYNYVRSLCSHRYIGTGERMTFVEQLLDSISISNPRSLAVLLGPVGLRYHSLHHLFPTLPYHAMHEAHRRLAAALPPRHPYLQTIAPGMARVLRDLWRASGPPAVARGAQAVRP
jgi:fatty acid desaturase